MNRRILLALAATALVAAACSRDTEPRETTVQRQARITAEWERNLLLDKVLPRPSLSDAKDSENILDRIGGAYNGTTPDCFGIEDGAVLLRTKDDQLVHIASVDVRRYGKGGGARDFNSYTLEQKGAWRETVTLTLDEGDRSRWANFTEVLCPDDGQPWMEAWRRYNFPIFYPPYV